MGNTTSKLEQQYSKLKQEVFLLKSSILSVNEKINCRNNLNTKTKEIDPDNEKLEIQYLKNFLLGLEKEKTELEHWKASKFAKKVVKTLKNLNKLKAENGFKVWKKRMDDEYGSNVKDKAEIEGIYTMDSLEAIDGINEGNTEMNESENNRSEKIESLSIIHIYHIIEDFIFYKHLQNIKESIRKVPITRMRESLREYVSQPYNKNSLLSPDSVFESLFEHSDKHDLINVLNDLVSCTKSYKFPVQIELLVTDLINSFNNIKILTDTDSPPTNRACRMEGGLASLPNVFKMLNNLIGSKKLIYRILYILKPSEVSKTDYLHYLITSLLNTCNLNPEELYKKLNYAQNKEIWCSDIIDAIKFYSKLRIPEEDFKYLFEVFMQNRDSRLNKELILQRLNSKSVIIQTILIKKVQLIKAVIDVFRRVEQEFLQFALLKFEEQDSEHLNLTQFAKVLKKLNKNYDWDFAHSLFSSKKKSTQNKHLISKKSFKKLIKNHTISNKTLFKFLKNYEGRTQTSPEQFHNLSENFLTESNTEDLENSLTVLIEDLEI